MKIDELLDQHKEWIKKSTEPAPFKMGMLTVEIDLTREQVILRRDHNSSPNPTNIFICFEDMKMIYQ